MTQINLWSVKDQQVVNEDPLCCIADCWTLLQQVYPTMIPVQVGHFIHLFTYAGEHWDAIEIVEGNCG